ncbi:MAG: dihydrolipoyl dehydrogenase [Peptococcaceae bacterium]|jgi:dihydrolipoamide dehydrogenase|nr:dihydrolipoyl dehydrogenase [Peptococcaceae bacterium]
MRVTVLGAGPAGYASALRAAQKGAKVTLIEKERIGGTCLNRGCIPTKVWVESARRWSTIQESANFGLEYMVHRPNIQAIVTRKNQVVETLVGGIQQLMAIHKVHVLRGLGTVVNPRLVSVQLEDGSREEIENDYLILATGSEPASLAIQGLDLPGVLTSKEALDLTNIPASFVVIGGGVIGLEFANIFRVLGSKVTVVEILPRILPGVDGEIVRRLMPILKKNGIDIKVSTKLLEIKKKDDHLVVTLEGSKGVETLTTENVLVATGRIPSLCGVEAQTLGLELDGRFVKVNEYMETNLPRVYAIGDMVKSPMLAHVATAEAETAVENIFGAKRAMNYSAVPAAVFISPEVAYVGLTEEEAKEQGLAYKVGKFPFTASGRALTLGEAQGVVKIITSEDGRIIGAHILGPQASELISELTLALRWGLTVGQVSHTIHVHPSLAEAVLESAHSVFGKSLHFS